MSIRVSNKIAYVITSLDVGGAQMMLLKILANLTEDYQPYVVSLTSDGIIGKHIESLGIPVRYLGLNSKIGSLAGFVKLIFILRNIKPDIVHTFMYHADLLGGIVAKIINVPVIFWGIRHSDLPPQIHKYSTLLIARLCALISCYVPDKILCNSITARKIHVNLGYTNSKIIIIPNGFDTNLFKPEDDYYIELRKQLSINVNSKIIGLVGRYHPQKNHKSFIQNVAKNIHEYMPNVNFVLVGENITNENAELLSVIDQSGLINVTHLLGLCNNMEKIIPGFDALISASVSGEGFPNVIGEAMACGIPCVVTDVGDSRIIVDDKGKVVPANNLEEMISPLIKILSLSKSEKNQVAKECRDHIIKQYEIGGIVKKHEFLYRKILTNKNKC